MKALPWILVAILVAVVVWNYTHPLPPTIIPTTVVVRDSANKSNQAERERIDSLVVELKKAKTATIAAILKERAKKPAILGADTIYIPAPIDSAQPLPPDSCFTHDQLASLETQFQACMATNDSLRWDVKIWKARGDSVAARLEVCLDKPWKSAPVTFGLGYAAGITTCLVLK